MRLFYAKGLKEGTSEVQLDDIDTRHITKSLRLGVQDKVQLTNGRGLMAVGTIAKMDKRYTVLRVTDIETVDRNWSTEITIAIAPTKNMDRLEWFVEKAVEIGINKIIPVSCQNSERQYLKIDRLERIAISAMKQSQQAWLPEIAELTPVTEVIDNCADESKLIAHCEDDLERETLHAIESTVCLLIGPEGDFSHEEIAMAMRNEFVPTTFGENRLRTETAGLFGLNLIHFMS